MSLDEPNKEIDEIWVVEAFRASLTLRLSRAFEPTAVLAFRTLRVLQSSILAAQPDRFNQMKMKMIVREPKEDDQEAIREVKSLAVIPLRKIYKPTQAALAQKASRTHTRKQIVCECDGRIVATVEYEDHGDRFHILGPIVHPDYQRKGIARSLMDYIAGIAEEMGKRTLSLNTCKQTGNVAIFGKLDFRVMMETPDAPEMAENLTNEELINAYMEREIGQQ